MVVKSWKSTARLTFSPLNCEMLCYGFKAPHNQRQKHGDDCQVPVPVTKQIFHDKRENNQGSCREEGNMFNNRVKGWDGKHIRKVPRLQTFGILYGSLYKIIWH